MPLTFSALSVSGARSPEEAVKHADTGGLTASIPRDADLPSLEWARQFAFIPSFQVLLRLGSRDLTLRNRDPGEMVV